MNIKKKIPLKQIAFKNKVNWSGKAPDLAKKTPTSQGVKRKYA